MTTYFRIVTLEILRDLFADRIGEFIDSLEPIQGIGEPDKGELI